MNILTLFSEFAQVLTKPTYQNLLVLTEGAILSSGARTVTECLRSVWPCVKKHFTTYENVPRRARMNELGMARILFKIVMRLQPADSPVELIIDETLVRRWGPYVHGVSLHRDGVRSTRGNNELTPGNMWVVLAIAIKLPIMENVIALPILSMLYISEKRWRGSPVKFRRKHRTPSELAEIMVMLVSRWMPGQRFRLTGDARYATHRLADLLNARSKRCPQGTMVSRFRMDARIHEEPGEYSGFGRPRIKGKQLPCPAEMASRPDANWVLDKVTWYGGKVREFMLLSSDGLWYRCGQSATWVRWVIVRDPAGKNKDEIFFTTDITLSPAQIVECFVRRWSIEVTFEEMRRHLGIETLKNRSYNSIKRSVPMLFALFSLITVCFALSKDRNSECSNKAPWYDKQYTTFGDMLNSARHDILTNIVFQQLGENTFEFQVAPFPLNILYSLIAVKRKTA